MATVTKVIRVKNPRRRARRNPTRTRMYRNAKGRFVKRSRVRRPATRTHKRKAARTTPVIRRYSVKALKKELRKRGVRTNPRATTRRRRHVRRRTARRSVRRRTNPVLIELGAVNPRRRTHVAKNRVRRNPRRRRHASATARVHHRRRVVRRRRRSNPIARVNRRRHHRRVNRRHRVMNRRRNPMLFGRSSGKDIAIMIGGGLIGVAATKYLPTLIPSSITANIGTSPIMNVVVTGAGAFVASMIARKVLGEPFADAVLFGGLMQTGSALLNAFAPAALSQRLALAGVGDIMPGYFPVPQNSITGRPPMAVMASPGGGGVGAFSRAFGGRR